MKAAGSGLLNAQARPNPKAIEWSSMAQAEKFPSTRNLPKTDESVGDMSPPIGKRHEKPIFIPQP